MPTITPSADLATLAKDPGPRPAARASGMASGLKGSEILRIAAEIRSFAAAGNPVCDLTVGDFAPRHFPVPASLSAGVREALERGETNYPPSNGMPVLRDAVRRFYSRELGLDYPPESILIAGGARPLIYSLYRTVCDPGDRVVYPVPSWNNNHYAFQVGAQGVPVVCGVESRFMPTAPQLAPHLAGARLLCLNSPLNPCGTVISGDGLRAICELVIGENARRDARGERPLYLMWDHIYWMLCFGDARHVTPSGLLPEMARYTLMVDGISKAFAATGLRVGFGVGPVDLIGRMSSLLGHVGAWAPRAEQVATASLLDDDEAIATYHASFKAAIEKRLRVLHGGFQAMKSEGLPADSVEPMGAIYLSARIHPFGSTTPQGVRLDTNEAIRHYVLEAAGIAVVPFGAFGSTTDDGWFRLSVGAVGLDDIEAALPRLTRALRALR